MENSVYYRHGKTTDGYRYTIAGQFDRNGYGEPLLHMAIAFCSKKDQFCKASGRLKARAKLLGSASTGIHTLNIALSIGFIMEMTAREMWITASDFTGADKKTMFKAFNMRYYPEKK